VDSDVIAVCGTCPGSLVDDRGATVDARPGKDCCFAVVAGGSAAEFCLVAGEGDDFSDFAQFSDLDPGQADCGCQRWMRRVRARSQQVVKFRAQRLQRNGALLGQVLDGHGSP